MKTTNAQFKSNLDSITISDVQALKERKAKHALDLDSLNIPLKTADQYVEVIQDFLDSLNFSKDQIKAFGYRRRDGYIPHSYNNGGLEGIAYLSQTCLPNGSTGFDNVDAVLERRYQYDLKNWMEENKHPSQDSMNESDYESFEEYRNEGDDTIQFQARIMMTSETTANVDFYISAGDSPYHRSSDDKLEVEIEFKSPVGMKRKLAALLKNEFVSQFVKNVQDGY